jgi:hypothetical protein
MQRLMKFLFVSFCPLFCLQSLTGSLDRLQGRLQQRGLSQQAEAIAGAKQSIVGAVSEAAGNIKSYVQVRWMREVSCLCLCCCCGCCWYVETGSGVHLAAVSQCRLQERGLYLATLKPLRGPSRALWGAVSEAAGNLKSYVQVSWIRGVFVCACCCCCGCC